MSNEDWYRRHVGGGTGSAYPSQARQYAPPPIPAAYQPPPGYQLVPVAPQVPVFTPPGSVGPWSDDGLPPVDTTRIPNGTVNPSNFMYMAQFWRGGRGRKEAQHCPRCDGVLFRRFEGQREAAPLCTACGWNGLFDQGEHAHVA